MGTLVKFWKGWITAEHTENPTWLPTWKKAAAEAKEENCELVVFKIPFGKGSTNADSQVITEIEAYLQERFKYKK